MKILICIFIFLFQCSFAFAQAGYKRTPWGSNTWVGPGTPPHWSTYNSESGSKEKKYTKKRHHYHTHKKRIHHKPSYRHTQTRKVYIPIERHTKQPRVQTKTVVKTRYVPVPVKPSATVCGGDALYLKNKNTGEITIKYVSTAKKC